MYSIATVLQLLDRLMVGQRTLTPSMLVRIQLKQPPRKPRNLGLFSYLITFYVQG